MILGYVSISLTFVIIIALSILKVKSIYYYGGIFVIAALLVFSTTMANGGSIPTGTDINVEIYYARQTLINGYWDYNLPMSVNACLPASVLAPAISKLGIPITYVFTVIYPLLFSLVPVFLLYIYSRFMPIKWAFLASAFFILMPIFFIEIPQIARQEVSELIIVAVLAVLASKLQDRYKITALVIGSALLVVSHYASLVYWVAVLLALVIGYAVMKYKKMAVACFLVLLLSVGGFYEYSKTVGSGLVANDMGNVFAFMSHTIGKGNGSVIEVMPSKVAETPPIIPNQTQPDGQNTAAPAPQQSVKYIGASEFVMQLALGIDINTVDTASRLFRIIQIITEILLAIGVIVMVRRKEIPKLYKTLVIAGTIMLLAALVFPVITAPVNGTRYYHMVLILVAPAFIYGISLLARRWTTIAGMSVLLVYFVFTSGLVFHFTQDDITSLTTPYSIALEDKRLDAGNYFTVDDDKVSRWAYDRYHIIYSDIGGVLIAENYYDINHALPVKPEYKSGDIIFVRTWCVENNGRSAWAGPGLRQKMPFELPAGKIIYQVGKAYLWEVS